MLYFSVVLQVATVFSTWAVVLSVHCQTIKYHFVRDSHRYRRTVLFRMRRTMNSVSDENAIEQKNEVRCLV
ncbi:hypothetical protein ARMSODRAFT_457368 [Armillaria solidipes]|uniref:Uncharacterized protein n=1 Tax=Armillaria solidipes TaxID=1076256 RepID=A0A2H3BLB5_9AGAR|nr:hypothetical protein ARMSODRAFT_457368 [Armillaria solidipes]